MSVVDEIIALKVPNISEVIVIGGAFMELLGLRKADDIDMAVSDNNWRYLLSLPGWHMEPKGTSECLTDTHGRYDVWPGWYDWKSNQPISFDELLMNSKLHEMGFRIPTVEYQIHLKQAEGRRKDIQDIHMLRQRRKP